MDNEEMHLELMANITATNFLLEQVLLKVLALTSAKPSADLRWLFTLVNQRLDDIPATDEPAVKALMAKVRERINRTYRSLDASVQALEMQQPSRQHAKAQRQ